MSIEISNLQRATIVIRYRSLRRAADALGIRQSTLSRSLRSLEDQAGVTLFQRGKSGTCPTEAGLQFLTDAQRLVDEAAVLMARLKAQVVGKSGHLKIGVCTSLSAGNLRATLIEHRRHFPDVEMGLDDASSERLISRLRTH